MLGLGETEEDVIEATEDLYNVGVHILTLGQYLQPTKLNHPVIEWITPAQFEKYQKIGLEMDSSMESGPLVRSSYHAEKHLFDMQ
jgi:lipoic acid synthetase